MITYEDLLARFAKMAEDRLGAGGVLPSQADVNASQGAPSHDSKEKPDLPSKEPNKLTFDSGKCVKGPEEPKINKNVFMTRAKNSTIKQAEEAFTAGFLAGIEKEAESGLSSFMQQGKKLRSGGWHPVERESAQRAHRLGGKVSVKEVYPETTGPKGERIPRVVMAKTKLPSSLAPKGGFSERALSRSRSAISKGVKVPGVSQFFRKSAAEAFLDGFLDELDKVGASLPKSMRPKMPTPQMAPNQRVAGPPNGNLQTRLKRSKAIRKQIIGPIPKGEGPAAISKQIGKTSLSGSIR